VALEFGDANSGLDLEAEEDADRWDVQLSSTPGENNRVFDHSRLFVHKLPFTTTYICIFLFYFLKKE
jgi:hypothetical protein